MADSSMSGRVHSLLYPEDEERQRINAKTKAYLNNPFIKSDGSLANKYLNYQQILDNPGTSPVIAQKITQATGLVSSVRPQIKNMSNDASQLTGRDKTYAETAGQSYSDYRTNTGDASQNDRRVSSFAKSVGKKVADTGSYNNSAAKGQCVWYVRGRAQEKMGVNLGSMGNGNQMWYNAKDDAKLAPTAANIKPNTIVSYKYGTSSAGKKYGHVIYIEDVVGDTVYYTEGGTTYHNNGTDGVIKTATRQGILDGVNNNGGHMGSGVIGIIDLNKYL